MGNIKILKKENGFVKFVRILLLIILLPVVVVYTICQFLKNRKLKKQAKEKVHIYSVSQIDTISGTDFEILLKDVFEKLGYKCLLTKTSHDYGADIVLEKGKNKSIVQAKCYGKTVGVKAVQEIVSARRHYGIQDAVVATNNYFSKEAQILADENSVRLVDRDVLVSLIKQTEVRVSSSNTKYSCLAADEKSKIEAKYPYWI